MSANNSAAKAREKQLKKGRVINRKKKKSNTLKRKLKRQAK